MLSEPARWVIERLGEPGWTYHDAKYLRRLLGDKLLEVRWFDRLQVNLSYQTLLPLLGRWDRLRIWWAADRCMRRIGRAQNDIEHHRRADRDRADRLRATLIWQEAKEAYATSDRTGEVAAGPFEGAGLADLRVARGPSGG